MKQKYFAFGEQLLLTLWVGGMWFSGYVAAPILFQMLDRQTAGMVAGQLFMVTSYIGIFAALFLLLGQKVRPADGPSRGYRSWILLVMLAIIIIGQFVLTPMMQEIKATGLQAGSMEATSFARLHGISSILFLINSILGLILVVVGLRPSSETTQGN
jgi:hypothetical protein